MHKPQPEPPIPPHCPVGDYFMLQIEEQPDVSPGGIIIPEQAKDNPCEGVIVKIGPQADDGDFEVGDSLVYREHSAYKIRIDGVPFVFVQVANIILRTPKSHVERLKFTATTPTPA